MKIIIDTNILLSAILGNNSAVELINNSDFQFYASRQIIDEYKKLIRRDKFKLSNEKIIFWDSFISEKFIISNTHNKIKLSRDYQDAKFIELANEINADFLITSDKKLLNATNFTQTKIVKLENFIT